MSEAYDRSPEGSRPLDSALQLTALAQAPVMIRQFGGEISFWAAGMERLYRYTSAEAIGRRCQELLRTAFPAPLRDIEDEVRETGVWEGQLTRERHGGEAVVVSSQWSLLRGDGGQGPAIMACDLDISGQAAELAERQRLASIVESSEDAIIGKTLDGTITSWNRAAERIFGWSADEMLGRPIMRLFPEELVGEEAEIVERLRQGERIEHYETRRLRKSGTPIEVSLTVSGPGLPDQVMERLFQPFVTTKDTGMGVGLSLCRSIVEAHGGAISAENQERGGAVFRLRLPAA